MSIKLNSSGGGSVTLQEPSTEVNGVITFPAGTGTVTVSGLGSNIVSDTAKAWNWNGLTTNTFIDFTGIPSWAKRITVMFSGMSTSGTSNFLVQIGDSGGVEISGYDSIAVSIGSTPGVSSQTIGFILTQVVAAASVYKGHVVITNITGSDWVSSHSIGAVTPQVGTGAKTLSGILDRVRVTTVNGTDTFDAGNINIMYE